MLTRRVDMRSVAEIRTFIEATTERFPVIDVIYNNAGINHLGAIEDATEEEFDRVHDINLKAAFFLVKYALPALRKSDGASVVNVSSGAGLLAPADGNSLYCSSKGGLISLTRAQARDLAPDRIRSTACFPGRSRRPWSAGSRGDAGQRARGGPGDGAVPEHVQAVRAARGGCRLCCLPVLAGGRLHDSRDHPRRCLLDRV